MSARLAVLRQIAVVERDGPARARLAQESRLPAEPFPQAVRRRLRELRALSELTRYLHRARPDRQLK